MHSSQTVANVVREAALALVKDSSEAAIREVAKFWGVWPMAELYPERIELEHERVADRLVLESTVSGRELADELAHAVFAAFESRPHTRVTFGRGRGAAALAWQSCTITTAEHAAKVLGLEGRERAVFVAGFEAWERAATSAGGVEHWLRRELASRGALLGGRVRVDGDAIAVLDVAGQVHAEAWTEGGAWAWQAPSTSPDLFGDGFDRGSDLARLVARFRAH